MKRNLWAIVTTVLVLMVLTGFVLANRDSIQRLGEPGVKLVPVPSLNTNGDVINPVSVYMPETVLDYTGSNTPIADVVLGWLPGDTTYGQRIYTAPDGYWCQINVVLMGTDRTSIHKPQYCLTGVGWQITKTEYTTVAMDRPYPYDLPVIRLTAGQEFKMKDGRRVPMTATFVYWFVADGQVTAKHNARMVGILKDLPSGVLQRWAYVSCFSVSKPELADSTFERISKLIRAAVPEFQLAAGLPKGSG